MLRGLRKWFSKLALITKTEDMQQVLTTKRPEQLSLDLLFDYWQVASVRERYWKKELGKGNPRAHAKLVNLDVELRRLSAEIERRADLLPTALVLFLINSGNSFRFNKTN